MSIQKDLSSNSFLKLDKEAYKVLSNNAILVYLAFVDMHPNVNPTNSYMAEQCDMGRSRYKTAKAELIKNEFLYVQKLGVKGAAIIYHFGKQEVKRIKESLEKKKYIREEKVKKQAFLEKVEN